MAPPKDVENASSEAIKTLVSLIASSSEFNPDYNIVAAEVGISHAKNVPRKLDSILKPYGYQIKSKKVVKIGEEAPATPAKSAAKSKAKAVPKTPGGSDSDEDEKSEVDVSLVKKKATTPKKQKKTPAKKAAATPKRATKKRKLEETEQDDSENEEDESAENINGDGDIKDEVRDDDGSVVGDDDKDIKVDEEGDDDE